MFRRMSFFIRMFLSVMAVVITAIAFPAYYLFVSMDESFLAEAREQAFEKLELLSALFAMEAVTDGQNISYDRLVQELSKQDLRLTLIDEQGNVVYDSDLSFEATAVLDNHADRPEFKGALAGKQGFSLRYSNTLETDYIYVASRIDDQHILRLAFPYASFLQRMGNMLGAAGLVFAGGILLALLLAFSLSYGIRRQFKNMLDVIEAISLGKLNSRLHHVPGQEFAVLAQAVNRMAENIENQLVIMREQSLQLEVIFDTMQNGIILLDNHGNVRRTNRAFRELCHDLPDTDIVPIESKIQLIECLPVPILQNTVERLLNKSASYVPQNENSSQEIQEIRDNAANSTDVTYYLKTELMAGRHFAVYLAKPENPTEHMGLVIVMHEITEMIRLETIRKDFVANVSHELRTPLTSIQGYAETMESMAELPEDVRSFARIIHKHGSYLSVMVEDLLALARIENEKECFALSPITVLGAAQTAVSFCHKKFAQKRLQLCLNIDKNIMVNANQAQLERVFTNLLENACRYSHEGTDIILEASVTANTCTVSVQNTGLYIAPEHIERIFERFYRIEKNRSSISTGGNSNESGASTGLGLAICKHIIDRHGGNIKATSINHGDYGVTTFIFTLSLTDPETQTSLDNEETHEV